MNRQLPFIGIIRIRFQGLGESFSAFSSAPSKQNLAIKYDG
jgi:hypothetical protein